MDAQRTSDRRRYGRWALVAAPIVILAAVATIQLAREEHPPKITTQAAAPSASGLSTAEVIARARALMMKGAVQCAAASPGASENLTKLFQVRQQQLTQPNGPSSNALDELKNDCPPPPEPTLPEERTVIRVNGESTLRALNDPAVKAASAKALDCVRAAVPDVQVKDYQETYGNLLQQIGEFSKTGEQGQRELADLHARAQRFVSAYGNCRPQSDVQNLEKDKYYEALQQQPIEVRTAAERLLEMRRPTIPDSGAVENRHVCDVLPARFCRQS